MSTRQMAARYSGRGGGSGVAGMDLFGMHARRRAKEAQEMSDIDVNAEKAIMAFQASIEALKAAGVQPLDRNGNLTPQLEKIITEVDPIKVGNLRTGAETEGSKLGVAKDYFGSKRGEDVLRAATEAQTFRPAIDAAKVAERRLGIGETGQFFDPKDLFTGQPTIGRGAMPAEFDTKMVLDAKGKPTTQQIQTRGMTPGMFSAGTLSPDIKAAAAGISPVAGVAPAQPAQPKPPKQPFQGIVPMLSSGMDSISAATQPYQSFMQQPGAYYKNMLLDLLFGRDPERDASLILNTR